MALEPSVIQRGGFPPPFRYSCLHSRFHAVHEPFPARFDPHGTLSYPPARKDRCRAFGGVLEPRYILGAEPLDQ